MKDSLLKIAEYIEALEQRLAAQEARLAEQQELLADQAERLADLRSRVAELEARPIPEDPDIEMDWIDDEPEPEPEPQVQEEPEVEEEPEQPELPLTPEPEIAQSPNDPINDKMVNSKMVNNPVADLKHAISLGDRFLFQRELFGQNGELMQKTLEALNGMPNLDGALAYLDKHFNWDKDSSTFALFLNALHRRFG